MTELALRNGDGMAAPDFVNTFAGVARFAQLIAMTAFVPQSLRVVREDRSIDYEATAAQVTGAIMYGRELGLGEMTALRSVVVIRGTPALTAVAYRGLVQSAGHSIVVRESTATRAVVRVRRAGTNDVMESVWTIDRAKQMRIQGFGNPDGQWQRQPQNMLLARASAEASRWVAADRLLGLYVAEEIDDIDPETGPDTAPGPVPPKKQRAARRRTSPPPAGTAGPLPPPPPPANAGTVGGEAAGPGGNSAEADQDPGETDGGESPPAAPSESAATHEPGPAADPIEPGQVRRLGTGLKAAGITDPDVARGMVSRWVGREVAATADLTRTEAAQALDALHAWQQEAKTKPAYEDVQLPEEEQ